MPIQVELIKEERVVLQTYSDPLDSAQLILLRTKMDHVILPTATHKLYIIADFQEVRSLPSRLLNAATGMLRTRHANTGAIICVTKNPFANTMAQALNQLVPQQLVIVVSSLDEALQRVYALLESANT